MRHNRDEKRFDRTVGHLRCMLANMTSDLVSRGRITTTVERAKVLRRYAERMITLGKKGTVAARRRAFAFMRSKDAVNKLFSEVAGRFSSRNGGYTRIMRTGTRPGDGASMAIIELVEGPAAAAAATTAPAKEKKAAKPKAEAKAPAKEKAPAGEKKAAKPKAEAKPKAAKKESATKEKGAAKEKKAGKKA